MQRMDAPPQATARLDVTRLPAGTTEPDVVACGGAARDPHRRQAGRRDDAHARARRGARARLLPHRGHCRPSRPRRRPTSPRTPSRSRRRRFDRARVQRSFYTSSSCGVCGKGALEAVAVEAPRVESRLTWRRRSSRRCPTGCARSRPRSPRRAACTRPASSTPGGKRSACARTSAATTRWTR